MVSSFNFTFQNGTLSISQRQGIIFYFFIFFGFNALLTQKIVTTVYKNRKVKRENKKKKRIREKRIKPTHTARQYTVIA